MLAIHHPFDDLFAMPMPLLHRSRPTRHQLRETDESYDLTLPCPGIRPDDLQLSYKEGILSIKGETKTEHSHFSRSHSVRLPRDVNPETAAATLENGILTLTLPKRPRAVTEIKLVDTMAAAADDDYVLNIALPGIRPDDLKITAEDGVLSIDGESTLEHHGRVSTHSKRRLPEDADVDAAAATAANGIFTIVVPKRARPAPHKIEIGARTAIPMEAEAAEAPAPEDSSAASAA